MYRPTVRYNDVFREYVDDLFKATYLDRNQIIRGALFAAAYSKEFHELMASHKKKDVPLPSPGWKPQDYAYWLEQCPRMLREGEDVNVKQGGNSEDSEVTRNVVGGQSKGRSEAMAGCFEQTPRSTRAVPSKRVKIRDNGGITFTIN